MMEGAAPTSPAMPELLTALPKGELCLAETGWMLEHPAFLAYSKSARYFCRQLCGTLML